MNNPNLVLYYKPTCPYCHKVTNFMENNGITIEMRNTLESNNVEDLRALTGKTQVPCLVIDGKPMLESNDIIEYLRSQL